MEHLAGNAASSNGLLPRIAPPPRRVPLSLKLRSIFGGLGVFAWLWTAFSLPFSLVFLRDADLSSWRHFRGALVTVQGTAEGCEKTNASEGGSKSRRGTPIYANRYRFEAGGVEHTGVSYATGDCLEAGAAVDVEHEPGHPERSRIAGMRAAVFGPSVLLVLIFPLVGLGLLAGSIVLGRRQLHLLREGRVALGSLLSKEPTRSRANKRMVWKLRFALTTDRGTRHEVVIHSATPEDLEDDPRERFFYDPARPERAQAWDDLPWKPRLDGTGNFEPAGLAGTLGVLLLPALTVAIVALML